MPLSSKHPKRKDTIKIVSFLFCVCVRRTQHRFAAQLQTSFDRRSTSFRFSGHKRCGLTPNEVAALSQTLAPPPLLCHNKIQGVDSMKKVNILQLIASICLLVGNVINLLNLCLEIPFAVYVCTGPLFIISVILYSIVLIKKIKLKKSQLDDYSN